LDRWRRATALVREATAIGDRARQVPLVRKALRLATAAVALLRDARLPASNSAGDAAASRAVGHSRNSPGKSASAEPNPNSARPEASNSDAARTPPAAGRTSPPAASRS
jgi:hypothetical protein